MRASFDIFKHKPDSIGFDKWEKRGHVCIEGTTRDIEDIRLALIFSTKNGNWLVE